ncbi:MAG: DUF599 domain-containing protein [Hyphomicrobiaceae bacterium]
MLQLAELMTRTNDIAAITFFLATSVICGHLSNIGPLRSRNIASYVQAHRIQWMQNMAVRDNRVIDTILLGGLSHGNAFFASTSVIAVGGLSALLGSGDKIQEILERLPLVDKAPKALWEAKILLMLAIFIFAFFKFAWAFRLSHYTAIMIGSTPLLGKGDDAACDAHAIRTARLIGFAAEHANAGLRSFYFAIAALAWFFHPYAFMFATTWVLVILIRRDFFSRSRRVLAGQQP